MGRRRERPRNADREHHRNAAATRIAAALEVIRLSDERWHGLAIWLSRSGMDRDAELLDRLAARSEQQARRERYRAEAMAARRRAS